MRKLLVRDANVDCALLSSAAVVGLFCGGHRVEPVAAPTPPVAVLGAYEGMRRDGEGVKLTWHTNSNIGGASITTI